MERSAVTWSHASRMCIRMLSFSLLRSQQGAHSSTQWSNRLGLHKYATVSIYHYLCILSCMIGAQVSSTCAAARALEASDAD